MGWIFTCRDEGPRRLHALAVARLSSLPSPATWSCWRHSGSPASPCPYPLVLLIRSLSASSVGRHTKTVKYFVSCCVFVNVFRSFFSCFYHFCPVVYAVFLWLCFGRFCIVLFFVLFYMAILWLYIRPYTTRYYMRTHKARVMYLYFM